MKANSHIRTFLLAGILTISSLSAAMACVPRGSADKATRDFQQFMSQNGNLFRSNEAEMVSGMYSEVISSLRGSEGQCTAPTPGAVAETNARFGMFYEQIGVGGRVLFDSFRPPFQENAWEGGRWAGWVPSTGR